MVQQITAPHTTELIKERAHIRQVFRGRSARYRRSQSGFGVAQANQYLLGKIKSKRQTLARLVEKLQTTATAALGRLQPLFRRWRSLIKKAMRCSTSCSRASGSHGRCAGH